MINSIMYILQESTKIFRFGNYGKIFQFRIYGKKNFLEFEF